MTDRMIRTLALAAGLLGLGALPSGAQVPSSPEAFVVTSDFVSGNSARLAPSPVPRLQASNLVDQVEATSGDAVAVAGEGSFYVVHRGFAGKGIRNTIHEVGVGKLHDLDADPDADFSSAPNVQDLVEAGGTKFVSLFEDPQGLAVCEPTGGCESRIDVCAGVPTGGDGNCEAGAMALDGEVLYVAMSALDFFSVTGGGWIAVVDVASRTRIGLIPLLTSNPSKIISTPDGKLLVSSSGSFFPRVLSGGIEEVDPSTGTTSLLVDDDALGGNVSDLVLATPLTAYAIVDSSRVVRFLPLLAGLGMPMIETVYDTGSFFIGDIEADGYGGLLIADTIHPEAAALVRIDPATGGETERFTTSLGPVSIAVANRAL